MESPISNATSQVSEDESIEELKDQEVDAQAQQLQRIISTIPPEVEKLPDLYKAVVKRLVDSKAGRCRTWSEYKLVQSFHGWLNTASMTDKPNIEVLVALLAAHKILAHGPTSKFNNGIQKRGLEEWLQQELKAKIERAKEKGREERKKDKTRKLKDKKRKLKDFKLEPAEPTEKGLLQSIKQRPEDIPRPSIEPTTNFPERSSTSFAPFFVSTLRREETQPTYQASEPRAKSTLVSLSPVLQPMPEPSMKRQRTKYLPPPRRIANCDAWSQTDESMFHAWTLQNVAQFVQPIKEAFEDVVSGQTEALTRNVPIALQTAIRQTVEAEMNRQRNDQILSHQRPGGPLTTLPPRRVQFVNHYQAPPRTYTYGERVVPERQGRPHPAPEGDLVFDFQAYQYVGEPERRER